MYKHCILLMHTHVGNKCLKSCMGMIPTQSGCLWGEDGLHKGGGQSTQRISIVCVMLYFFFKKDFD